MAPFARNAHSCGPSEAIGRKDARGRRERMRNAGGMVCGVMAGGAAGQEASRNPPGGRSQICLGDGHSAPPAPRVASGAALAAAGPPPKMQQADSAPKSCADPPKTYADMLAAQIEEKKALKAAEKARHREADREDDARVWREAGQLKEQAEGEVAKQRAREQRCAQRQDSLSRFLAEQEPGRGQGQAQAPSGASPPPAPAGRGAAEEEQLDARRRAVPGLCGKPPTPPRAESRAANVGGAAAAGARCPSAGQRTRSTPPPRQSHCPFAMDSERPAAQPPQPQPAANTRASCSMLPGHREEVRSGVSANVWANGGNQNCGNFISDRPTSRVIQPPGGGSSFQLG